MTHRSGFTLLELLLALAMTVLVAGALASSLYTAFRARASAEAAVNATRIIDGAADTMAQDLTNALPPTATAAASGGAAAQSASGGAAGLATISPGTLVGPFEGAADTVDFCTSGPEPKADIQGDVREIVYLLEPDPNASGGQMLVRRVFTNLLAQPIVTPPDEVVCRNVQSIAFSYYDGTNWGDTWDSTQESNTLPLGVQVTLTLAATRSAPAQQTVRLVPFSCGVASSSSTTTIGGGL